MGSLFKHFEINIFQKYLLSTQVSMYNDHIGVGDKNLHTCVIFCEGTKPYNSVRLAELIYTKHRDCFL